MFALRRFNTERSLASNNVVGANKRQLTPQCSLGVVKGYQVRLSPLTTGWPDRGHILSSRAHTGLELNWSGASDYVKINKFCYKESTS